MLKIQEHDPTDHIIELASLTFNDNSIMLAINDYHARQPHRR